MSRLIKTNVFLDYMRDVYRKGDRVKLIKMEGEPQMHTGETGTINFVDDMGNIHVNWDNGSSLSLILNEDHFIKIN